MSGGSTMRQKTINFLFDKVMWYVLYFLPIILLIITSVNGTPTSISNMLTTIGIDISTSNIIYTTFVDMFGQGGLFELFINNDIFIYITYFIGLYLLHFVIDISLFIIKLTRKWLDNVIGGVE